MWFSDGSLGEGWRDLVETLRLGPAGSTHVVLFAAGAGGDPERHRPLLEHVLVTLVLATEVECRRARLRPTVGVW